MATKSKVKAQKNAAILLIIGPLIMLISYIGKTDVTKYGSNDYIICASLFLLSLCGIYALIRSLNKQKLKNQL